MQSEAPCVNRYCRCGIESRRQYRGHILYSLSLACIAIIVFITMIIIVVECAVYALRDKSIISQPFGLMLLFAAVRCSYVRSMIGFDRLLAACGGYNWWCRIYYIYIYCSLRAHVTRECCDLDGICEFQIGAARSSDRARVASIGWPSQTVCASPPSRCWVVRFGAGKVSRESLTFQSAAEVIYWLGMLQHVRCAHMLVCVCVFAMQVRSQVWRRHSICGCDTRENRHISSHRGKSICFPLCVFGRVTSINGVISCAELNVRPAFRECMRWTLVSSRWA